MLRSRNTRLCWDENTISDDILYIDQPTWQNAGCGVASLPHGDDLALFGGAAWVRQWRGHHIEDCRTLRWARQIGIRSVWAERHSPGKS